MSIDGGYPIYIMDDDEIIFTKTDLGHSEFWECTVRNIVATKYKISRHKLANLPYCQRRGRIVGNTLYCGEKLGKRLVKKIEKAVGTTLTVKHDEHEVRCEISVGQLNVLKSQVD